MGIVINEPIACRIHGIGITPLRQIVDERGVVLHMLRSDAPHFSKFGEIYFSQVNSGVVKAWKSHKKMTQHFAVPVGKIKLVLFDNRPASPSEGQVEELVLAIPDNYYLVRVPPMIWYGFQGMSDFPSIVANCTDMLYDPAECENREISDSYFPYRW